MKKLLTLILVTWTSLCISTTVFADIAKGQGIYMNFCAPCHDSGIAGAPKVGDKAAWQERIGKGTTALVDNAVNGFHSIRRYRHRQILLHNFFLFHQGPDSI